MCAANVYLLSVLVLAWSANAFNVTFFSDDRCERRLLGTVILGKDQGCHQDFAGVAESASVGITGLVDDKTFVQFYSTKDCSPGSETASSEDECVEIDGPDIDFYQSFRVIDDVVTPPLQPSQTLEPGDPIPTLVPRKNVESAKGLGEREIDPLVDKTNIYHGKRAHMDNVDYIWHQVYAGGFRGIPVDEWNPEKHVEERRSLDELLRDSGITRKRSLISETSPAPLHTLEARQQQCRFHQQCVRAFIATGIGLNALMSITIDDVKDVATVVGVKLDEFLQHPFVSQFTAGYLSNVLASVTVNFFTSKNVPIPPAQTVTTVIQVIGHVETLNVCTATPVTVVPGTSDVSAANEHFAEGLKSVFLNNPLKQNAMGVAYAVVPTQNPKKRGALLESRDTNILRIKANAMPCAIAFSEDVCGLSTGLCEG